MIRFPGSSVVPVLIRHACGLIVVLSTLVSGPDLNAREDLPPFVGDFFRKHCHECHGDSNQEADRRFDQLSLPIEEDSMLIDFQDALDQLNLGEMPPLDRPQPGPAERRRVVDWLTKTIEYAQTHRVPTAGETVLRRLNRREYLNTIRDLFDLKTTSFDPVADFPLDEKIHHLDNQGETLVMSGFLLEQYFKTADAVIEKVLPTLTQPPRQEWSFEDGFMQQPELDSRRIRAEKMVRNNKVDGLRIPTFMALYAEPQAQRHMGTHGHISDFREGVPHDGYYRITVWANAKYRQAELAKSKPSIADEPLRLSIVPGNQEYGDLHLPQPLATPLATFELEDEVLKPYTAEKIWLDRGVTPRFIYPNGPEKMRAPIIKAGGQLLKAKGNRKGDAFVEGMAFAELPQIHIERVQISGPFYDQWPTKKQIDLLGGKKFDPNLNRDNIRRILNRVFRRPPTGQEVDQVLAVIRTRENEGVAPFDAYQDGLKSAICSPSFLYLDERTQSDAPGEINNYAIASRLSYFLWATLPDDELLALAAENKLSDPGVRQRQAERMLQDPRSHSFIEGFLDSWLALETLGETAPDRSRFKKYYLENLEEAMRAETQLFTRHILDENLKIDNFLDSDFAFVNQALASHYGLPFDSKGTEFQKVSTQNHVRGGVLGQASVLTVSANGVDTSPVVRGVWILENILGTPPSPPPPDVEPLDPDIRGAKTIRDQLSKHRSHPACADCHKRIDPLGFALEKFDPIGGFRSRYPNKSQIIDASGEMPTGEKFDGIEDFKRILLKNRNKFARALTEKLTSYAIGRSVEISDRPATDEVLRRLDEQGQGFRDLILLIVKSELFVKP